MTDSSSAPIDVSALRLGCRGPLDPLLFLRAGSGTSVTTSDAPPPGGEKPVPSNEAFRKSDDLREALRRAEAEYAGSIFPEHGEAGDKNSMGGKPGQTTAGQGGGHAGRRS